MAFFCSAAGNIIVERGIHMKQMNHLTRCVTTAVCIALCVVLPFAFHAIPNGGTLFSPMHFPVLICGLVCGWPYGLLCGIAGPLLSSLLTGMPGIGYLPTMMVELAVYGLVTGLLMHFVRTGKTMIDVYISLIAAMLAGRVITGIARALIFAAGTYSWKAWATGYFVSSFPGIILQILIVPALYLALKKAKLIPSRYQ